MLVTSSSTDALACTFDIGFKLRGSGLRIKVKKEGEIWAETDHHLPADLWYPFLWEVWKVGFVQLLVGLLGGVGVFLIPRGRTGQIARYCAMPATINFTFTVDDFVARNDQNKAVKRASRQLMVCGSKNGKTMSLPGHTPQARSLTLSTSVAHASNQGMPGGQMDLPGGPDCGVEERFPVTTHVEGNRNTGLVFRIDVICRQQASSMLIPFPIPAPRLVIARMQLVIDV